MRAKQWVAAIFLAVGTAAAEDTNTLTAAEKAAGWELLFDGRTMKGWEDPSQRIPAGDSWTIENQCLKAVAHPRISEDLVSVGKYRDFELRFEWRISVGGNSGVKYGIQKRVFMENKTFQKGMAFEDLLGRELTQHLSDRSHLGPGEKGQEYVVSFEYQVIDDGRHPDARRGPLYQSGALYSLIPPQVPATRPVGEFNESRLIVRGNHVEHWLNGKKVMEDSLDSEAVKAGVGKRWKNVPEVYDLLVNRPVKDCPISLQNHGDEAWFRNLKIKRL